MAEDPVAWTGELLWPEDLPEGSVLDLAGVEALGTWTYGWFKSHPGTAVVGASDVVRQQLKLARVPVMCYDRLRDVPATRSSGVSLNERDLLWGDDGHG